jgi:acetyl esterase
MPLDADAVELLADIQASTSVLLRQPTVGALRAAGVEVASRNVRVPIPRVESFEIGSDAGPLRLRLYAHGEEPSRTMLFLHGGGFVMGSLETHDALVRQLVLRSGWNALSVDYRLAPEHRFPAALDDAYAALLWLTGPEAERKGVDARQITVCGESAGATIAAGLAIAARNRLNAAISRQILIYPPLDHRHDTESHRNAELQCQLTSARMSWYWEQYLGPGGDRSDPLAAPALCDDLSGLPEAIVVTAEYDPLRDEAESYARRLAGAGVATISRRFTGVFHGFLNLLSLQRTQQALQFVADCLREAAPR